MDLKTIAALAATPPPKINAFGICKDLYARCVQIETALGIPTSQFSLRPDVLTARLESLETQLAVKAGRTVAPPIAAPATITAPITATVSEITPDASDLLVKTFGQWLQMNAADRAQFSADGGKMVATEFDRMNARQKMNFIRAGGRIHDPEAAQPVTQARPAANTNSKTRASFEALNPVDRMAHIKAGGIVVD